MTNSSSTGKPAVVTPSQSDPVEKAERYRRKYLAALRKIPGEFSPGNWACEKKFRKICDEATRRKKLPKSLPEWFYDRLDAEIRNSSTGWNTLRRYSDDKKIAEQARKRIREAWITLHQLKDPRSKTSLHTVWRDYLLELRRVESVIETLRPLVTKHRGVPRLKLRRIALGWDLTEDDVENIWTERDKPRPVARELLAHRYNLKDGRLNHLLAASHKAFDSDDKKMTEAGDWLGRGWHSMVEPLVPPDIMVILARASLPI